MTAITIPAMAPAPSFLKLSRTPANTKQTNQNHGFAVLCTRRRSTSILGKESRVPANCFSMIFSAKQSQFYHFTQSSAASINKIVYFLGA